MQVLDHAFELDRAQGDELASLHGAVNRRSIRKLFDGGLAHGACGLGGVDPGGVVELVGVCDRASVCEDPDPEDDQCEEGDDAEDPSERHRNGLALSNVCEIICHPQQCAHVNGVCDRRRAPSLAPVTTDLLADLDARGLIHDTTDRDALAAALDAGMVTVYVGFDPTADCLHLGNYIGILALRRFQLAGHRPIALAGGSTGMVGDPGGRSEERNLLDEATLAHNLEGIKGVLRRFLDFDSSAENEAELVNNYDWTGDVNVLDFLRDVGKHVTVNQMMAKDSVKSRLDSEHGISFTEFSYMLLQAFDFWWLYENKNCIMQMGGSDQWGNITAGTDLIRKRSQGSAHALTWPLLTRADGAKFGKTADGALWLAADRTLPYELHQYFLRVADDDVRGMLLQLTLLSIAEVDEIMAAHETAPEKRVAQRRLADQCLLEIHGEDSVRQANLAAEALFGGGDLTGEMAESLRGIVPETEVGSDALDGDQNLLGLLVESGLCSSRNDARRKLGENQISVNGTKTDADAVAASDLIDGRFLLLQRGKKARHLVVFG